MECKSLPNHGYVQGVLKKSERDYLWNLIGEIDITDERKKQKQLTDIDNEFANTVLMPYVQTYVNEYGVPFKLNSTHSHDLCLSRFWSRISTEGDYQSIHDHQSVFTFVIWLKIPFDGNKELTFSHINRVTHEKMELRGFLNPEGKFLIADVKLNGQRCQRLE